MKNLHQKHFFIDTFKNLLKFYKGVIQKVRSLRRGGGSLQSEQKQTGREGPSMCVCSLFKKNAEIFKMKFYSYSRVFPIDYKGSMKY